MGSITCTCAQPPIHPLNLMSLLGSESLWLRPHNEAGLRQPWPVSHLDIRIGSKSKLSLDFERMVAARFSYIGHIHEAQISSKRFQADSCPRLLVGQRHLHAQFTVLPQITSGSTRNYLRNKRLLFADSPALLLLPSYSALNRT